MSMDITPAETEEIVTALRGRTIAQVIPTIAYDDLRSIELVLDNGARVCFSPETAWAEREAQSVEINTEART